MSESQSGFLDAELPQGETRRIHLKKAHMQIGRAGVCDIWLQHASVSRRHARLERPVEGAWRIVDLNSKNGTYVNGQSVKHAHLFDGDVIEIGSCRMTLRLPREAHPGEAELELDVVGEDTVSLLVDSIEMPPEESVPLRSLSELHEAMKRLSRADDVDSLLQAVADEFRTVLKPDRVAVGMRDNGGYHWPIVLDAAGQPLDGSDLPHRLVPKVKALTNSIPFNWNTFSRSMSVSSIRAKKAVKRCYIFPLNVDSDCLGHVYVERRDPNWEPSDSKIRFLALLAREAGLLLEKTRLLEDRRIAKDLQQELNEARKIQIDLFPRTLTLDHRLDIAACNHPCFGVSGDYYDCQLVSPGKITFILADVMGHGMKAAMLMAQLQVTFRMGIRGGWELDELDRRLDEVMAASSEGSFFATGILGIYDLANNVLSLVSAGHPWPSILSQGGRVSVPEEPSELPWGLSEEARRVCATTIAISRRWSLLGYTDGLTEAMDGLDRQYSAERLEKVHLQNLDSSAEDLCEVVLDDVLGHIGSSTFPKDDMTLLAICRSE